MKQGGSIRSWTKRWCILTEDGKMGWKKEKQESYKFLGTMDLECAFSVCEVVEKRTGGMRRRWEIN